MSENYMKFPDVNWELMMQFKGAVKSRIAERQKALWSRFIGAGFTVEDILFIWPDGDMNGFLMRTGSGNVRLKLSDLNLRGLDAVGQWIQQKQEQDFKEQPESEKSNTTGTTL